MNTPIEYIKDFISNPSTIAERLWSELAWERRETTPRFEYYCNDFNIPYTYGAGRGVRTYDPQPYHPLILEIRNKIEELTKTTFEVCFLNGYKDQRDHLGWHADDSPEMDDERPIAIVSFGAEREIWFCPQTDRDDVTKLLLNSGSLCLMKPGMQDTHFHRIPKASSLVGSRVSLTFRGYVK